MSLLLRQLPLGLGAWCEAGNSSDTAYLASRPIATLPVGAQAFDLNH